MNEPKKSILDKLYDCFNSGVEWGVSYAKNPCHPRKRFGRKGSESSKDDFSGTESERKKGSHYKENAEGKDSQRESEDKLDSKQKSEDCPELEKPPSCVILMQDPTVPFYCDEQEKNKDSSSTKKGYSDEAREHNCCDCCKRQIYDKNYSGKENPFSGNIRLERA